MLNYLGGVLKILFSSIELDLISYVLIIYLLFDSFYVFNCMGMEMWFHLRHWRLSIRETWGFTELLCKFRVSSLVGIFV